MSSLSDGNIRIDANVELERNGETESAVETEMKMDVTNIVREMVNENYTEGFTFDPTYMTVMDPEPTLLHVTTQEPTTTMGPTGKLISI